MLVLSLLFWKRLKFRCSGGLLSVKLGGWVVLWMVVSVLGRVEGLLLFVGGRVVMVFFSVGSLVLMLVM